MKKAKLYPTLIVALCLPTAAVARSYKLDEILDLARKGNPGLAAGEQATAGIEAQLLEAKRSYYAHGRAQLALIPSASHHLHRPARSIVNPR
jgi:hypothetical protein